MADWRSVLGRAGLAARGVLYAILGLLAVRFALGTASSGDVSKQDAFALVESQPYGRILLIALAAGLVAMSLWQLTTAVTGDPVKGSEAKDRILYAIKGVLYGATAAAAIRAVGSSGQSSGGGGGGGSQQQATSMVLGLPGGAWIVGGVGVALVGYAGYHLVKHTVGAGFMDRLARYRLSTTADDAVLVAGRVGYGGRAVVIAITGIFFVVAAIQHQPSQSKGLSGSLVTLREQAWGTWLLGGVAIGLALFGIFSIVEAVYRRSA